MFCFMVVTTGQPTPPTARAARFREGLARLQASRIETDRVAAELLLRFKLHSRAMGLKDLWDKMAADMWDPAEGDTVRSDFVAARLVDVDFAAKGAPLTMDLMTIALLSATSFAIDGVREPVKESKWRWLAYALRWEAVLTAVNPDERLAAMAKMMAGDWKRAPRKKKFTREQEARIVSAAKGMAWPEVTRGIYSTLAKRFKCSAPTIKRVLDDELERRKERS